MKPSQNLIDFIKRKESFREMAYIPIGGDRWTYGYGFTYKDNNSPVQEGDSITLEDAETQLSQQLLSLGQALNMFTPSNVTQQQFDAVVSLCYNVGLHAIMSSGTGLMYQKGQNISQRFRLWDESNGVPVQGLLNRRLQEQEIYDKGVYPE